MSIVSQSLSSVLAFAQRGSSPVWNRQAPSSVVAAARSVGGSGRPPLARSAITAANVHSVAMTMPTFSLRCVASVEVAVEEFDLGSMHHLIEVLERRQTSYHLYCIG